MSCAFLEEAFQKSYIVAFKPEKLKLQFGDFEILKVVKV